MSAAAVAARFLRRGSARAAMLYVGRRLCGKFSEGVWAGRHAPCRPPLLRSVFSSYIRGVFSTIVYLVIFKVSFVVHKFRAFLLLY